MKKFILMVTVLTLTLCISGVNYEDGSNRLLEARKYHISTHLSLRVSNFGFFGSGNHVPQWPSLEYPASSGTDYLYQGAVWIGAKKVRRDADGNKLFWLNYPPVDEQDVIAENSPGFDPDIHSVVVVDTLTSVGFDGDWSYSQLLPAYITFEMDFVGHDQYQTYNPLDVVVRSILGIPSLLDDTFPYDPEGYFDFFITSPMEGDFPGMETMTSFYYDYSPFTLWGDPRHNQRKSGLSAGQFNHYPQYMAVRQRSFTWTYEDLYDMIFVSFDIYNTNPLDTLYDVAIGFFMDWDQNIDVGGYYAGDGYEFAYARDSNGENPHWAALKIFPWQENNFTSWTWTAGEGPDHRQPISIPPPAGLVTSNEKYWLMTGRNPDEDSFNPLRPVDWTPALPPQYETPAVQEMRLLTAIYGDMQGYEAPTANSINIPPGESLTFYSLVFMGDDLDDLKAKSLIAQAFFDSGFDLSPYEDEYFRPFLTSFETEDNNIMLSWHIDQEADDLFLHYRQMTVPPADWQTVELETDVDNYVLEDLEYDIRYQFKIAAEYDGLYLESSTQNLKPTVTSVDGDYFLKPYEGSRLVGNYPNPFNPETRIVFYLEKPSRVNLEIYNIRGQLVTSLADQDYDSGLHHVIWNGKDLNNNEVASGVYFSRFKSSDTKETGKLLLLK